MLGTEVLTSKSDGVLTITINRPQHGNSVNQSLSTTIAQTLAKAATNPLIKAIIITGAGDRFFCAGADVGALQSEESVLPATPFEEWGLAGAVARTTPQPVIAAVNGLAYGGGFEIALNADFIIAEEHARFAFPEIKVGIFPGAGGVFRLRDALPNQLALKMLMLGNSLTAQEAADLHMVLEVTEQGGSLQRAQVFAQSLAEAPPLGIRMIKQLFHDLSDDGKFDGEKHLWEKNNSLRDSILSSSDAREGLSAFLERRQPSWTGS